MYCSFDCFLIEYRYVFKLRAYDFVDNIVDNAELFTKRPIKLALICGQVIHGMLKRKETQHGGIVWKLLQIFGKTSL